MGREVTKKLFDKNEKWTPEAMKIGDEFESVLWPIIQKYAKEGYSIREIGHILDNTGNCLILLELI